MSIAPGTESRLPKKTIPPKRSFEELDHLAAPLANQTDPAANHNGHATSFQRNQ
jgi:hypothetical protein